MFERRAADRYRLRMHRARTVALTNDEIVEVRAAQRTFEGAYIRTALSQFSFALVVLKIFTNEFYSTGALFAVYGTGVLIIGLFRRQQGNRQFFSEVGEDGVHRHKFRTSGNAVVILTALSIAAYATLIALTLRLDNDEYPASDTAIRQAPRNPHTMAEVTLYTCQQRSTRRIGPHWVTSSEHGDHETVHAQFAKNKEYIMMDNEMHPLSDGYAETSQYDKTQELGIKAQPQHASSR